MLSLYYTIGRWIEVALQMFDLYKRLRLIVFKRNHRSLSLKVTLKGIYDITSLLGIFAIFIYNQGSVREALR